MRGRDEKLKVARRTDLRKTFDGILVAVAESLRDAGFVRNGDSITRQRRFYIEHFSFQADKYNLRDYRCRYDLNVGIQYAMLSATGAWAFNRNNGLLSWRGKQSVPLLYIRPEVVWATRAGSLVPGLPAHWDVVPDADPARIEAEITSAIRATSAAMVPWAWSQLGWACTFWLATPLLWPFYAHAQRTSQR